MATTVDRTTVKLEKVVDDAEAGNEASGDTAPGEKKRSDKSVKSMRGKASDDATTGDDTTGGDVVIAEAADDDAVAAVAAEDSPVAATGSRRWLRRIGACVLVLAAVASAVFAGMAYREHDRLDAQEQLRQRYVATARAGVEALTTVNAKTVDADVAKLLGMASGDFKTEFGGRSESYKQVVGDAQATSKGTIVSIGVEKMDDSSATLLVAAHAEVTNEGTTAPETRDYRFRVLVTNGSPQTMSKVDFVV